MLAAYTAKYVGDERTKDSRFDLSWKFGGTDGQVYDTTYLVTPADKNDAPTEARPGGKIKQEAAFDVPRAPSRVARLLPKATPTGSTRLRRLQVLRRAPESPSSVTHEQEHRHGGHRRCRRRRAQVTSMWSPLLRARSGRPTRRLLDGVLVSTTGSWNERRTPSTWTT